MSCLTYVRVQVSLQSENFDVFQDAWVDNEGTEVTVKDSIMYGPDGGQLPLQITGATSCKFEVGSDVYEGTVGPQGKLQWNDGAIWTRAAGEHSKSAQSDEAALGDFSLSKNQQKKLRKRRQSRLLQQPSKA